MKTRALTVALPASLAALLLATGCARKAPEAPAPEAAPPEAAAPAAAPAPSAETAPAAPAPEAGAAPASQATPAAATAAPTSLQAGATVFKTYCETCHGPTGRGDGPAAVALNPKPADFADAMFKYDANGNGTKGDIDDIKLIAHNGAAKFGGSPLMAPWPSLTPDQLQAVAEYVKSLHKG